MLLPCEVFKRGEIGVVESLTGRGFPEKCPETQW